MLSQIGDECKVVGVERISDRRSDEELLAATADGDADAFAAFYARHIALVVAVLAQRTGSCELAADLAGETFASALLGCRRFRAGGPPAAAWLLGIAQNKLRESARRQRVDTRARERLGIPVLELEDEDLVRIGELAADGEQALALLDQLPAAQRDAVRARVLEDAEYRELATQMGCSEQVARQHVSRGLRRLRTQLKEHR
ncbi:MAG TPA: RNA polymerase sigma factor [Solirubrobacteraceae bacterium]